jgi:tetratricopeptide (TPR) repeat protein
VTARERLMASLKAAPDPRTARLDGARLVERYLGPPALTTELVAPLLAGAGPSPPAMALGARAAWRAGEAERARGIMAAYLARYPGRVAQDEGRGELVGALRAAVGAGDALGVEVLAVALAQLSDRVSVELAASHVARLLEEALDTMDAAASGPVAEVVARLVVAAAENSPAAAPWVPSANKAVEEARGDRDAAIAGFEAALARRTERSANANNLAYALATYGRDLGRALRLIGEAEAASADVHSSHLDTEAWVLHRLGRSAEALPIIRRAVRLSFGEERKPAEALAEMMFHLAEIEAAVGDPAAAAVTLRQCASEAPGSAFGRRCLARLRQAPHL